MMRREILLSLLLASFIGQAKQQESKTIDSPEGSISVKSKKAPSVPQEIVPLHGEKIREINELDKVAVQFLFAYKLGTTPSLKAYDEAFRLWQRDEVSLFSANEVVERLGSYLGNKLVKDCDMEWVQINDEYGTDLAVRARKYEVISYPMSSVAKRIQNNQYDFMAGVYHAVQDAIARSPRRR